jgi:hypothetical protein
MFSSVFLAASLQAAAAPTDNPAFAAQAPVTYNCKIAGPNAAEIRFTVDAGSTMVNMFVPKTGHREMMIGFFSAEAVSFASNTLISYEIDRASGSIRRMVPRASYAENGTCTAV